MTVSRSNTDTEGWKFWRKSPRSVLLGALSIALLLTAFALYLAGVSIGNRLGYYEAQSDFRVEQSENEINNRVEDCFDASSPDRVRECAVEEIGAIREDQRSEQNLVAQKQMAEWGFWLLIFTFGQSILGILGFVALLVTIRQGRDANEIARDVSRRELRAYLSVKAVSLDENDWNQDQLSILIEAQNAGQTPAVLTKIKLWVAWAFEGGDKTVIDLESKNEVRCHRGTPMLIPFGFDATDNEFEKSGHLTVVGRLEYKDIFGSTHKEPFSFRTQEGHFMPLDDHDFPVRLAAFSPLSMLELIEQIEAMQKAEQKSPSDRD